MRRMILRPRELYRFLFKKGRGVGLFLLLWTFSSCGIDSYPVLYEPIPNYYSTSIGFLHNHNNDPTSFLTLGYDIYYRIYNNENDDITDDIIIQDAQQHLTPIIDKLLNRIWTKDDLYWRIYLTNPKLEEKSPPVFKIANVSSLEYQINIVLNENNGSDNYIFNTYDSSKLYFSRYTGTNSEPKGYSKNDFSVDDFDVKESSTKYKIAFFALTYGLSTSYHQALHTNALYIGSIDIF